MMQYITYIFSLSSSYKRHLLSANKPFKAKWLLHARVGLILYIIHFFHIVYLCAPFDLTVTRDYFPWPHILLVNDNTVCFG